MALWVAYNEVPYVSYNYSLVPHVFGTKRAGVLCSSLCNYFNHVWDVLLIIKVLRVSNITDTLTLSCTIRLNYTRSFSADTTLT